MASAIVPGKIELVMVSPSGNQVPVAYDTQAFGACADGSVSNSYEKWPFQPVLKEAMEGGELWVRATITAAKTLDASDAIWQIPIFNLDSGKVETLGNNSGDFDILALADIAIVASTPTVVARKRMTGKRWTIGGGRVFLTLQDNA